MPCRLPRTLDSKSLLRFLDYFRRGYVGAIWPRDRAEQLKPFLREHKSLQFIRRNANVPLKRQFSAMFERIANYVEERQTPEPNCYELSSGI